MGSIYIALEVYSWPLVRAATGFFFPAARDAEAVRVLGRRHPQDRRGLAKQGRNPSLFWAYYIGCLELFGRICLILGLLARPVAALFAGFMFVAAFHVGMPRGWFWNAGGMEVPLNLLLICLAILICGGGLDRRLGREI